MLIDSHQHFWNYNKTRDAWINKKMNVLKNNFLPDDLLTELKNNNIEGCLAVQVDQSEAETEFLIQLAKKYSFIKGVIGWLDLKSNNIKSRLDYFSKYSCFKGVRHIVQSESSGFLDQTTFLNGIAKLQEYNLTYDLLVFPNQLDEVIRFVKKFPDQIFILDHMAKPLIKDKITQPWSDKIVELGKLENVSCKISGMITEADWQNWTSSDFTPYIETVINAFGEDRVLYGSDWPVCLLAGTYSKVKKLIEGYFPTNKNSKFWGENAKKIYNLSD